MATPSPCRLLVENMDQLNGLYKFPRMLICSITGVTLFNEAIITYFILNWYDVIFKELLMLKKIPHFYCVRPPIAFNISCMNWQNTIYFLQVVACFNLTFVHLDVYISIHQNWYSHNLVLQAHSIIKIIFHGLFLSTVIKSIEYNNNNNNTIQLY